MNALSRDSQCSRCQKLHGTFACGSCGDSLCKSCTEFVDSEQFSFMINPPKELTASQFCQSCYVSEFQPAQQHYNEIVARAKKVIIVDTPQRRPLPIVQNSKELLRVEDCSDQPDTFLRLAFLAAEKGFNAVIQVKVVYKKVRNAGYQTTVWSGTGYPATLATERL